MCKFNGALAVIRPSARSKSVLALSLGALVFTVGAFIAISPVQTSVGAGCEDGGCSMMVNVTVPALALGSAIIVLGILIFALGMNTE